MSAGYIIYSLDWDKFQQLVQRPTTDQLTTLAKLLRDELAVYDGEFAEGDPILDWPTDAESLSQIVAKRLALADWYGDLSRAGKSLWEGVVFTASMNCGDIDVGFRVDHDGVYWDVFELAWQHLGVVRNTITDVALSAFGTRPFRYHQRSKPDMSRDDDWTPMHSMHTPQELQKMRAELKSVEAAMMATEDEDTRNQYEEDLMPAIEGVVADGRMLFIQVDT